MTSQTTTQVWHNSNAKGEARLLLLALAENCDHAGVCRMSGRHMRELTLQDGPTFSKALRELLALVEVVPAEDGNLRVVLPAKLNQTVPAEPNGKTARPVLGVAIEAPAPARPAVDPFASVRKPYPKNLVGLLLQAARVKMEPERPFYWHQREHSVDAAELVRIAGGSVDDAVSRLKRTAPEEGQTIKRLLQLRPMIESTRNRA
jgi:hypothetical protein